MKCHDARLFLTASIDNELDTGDAIRLQQHLTDCAECRRVEEQEMSLRYSLQQSDLRAQPAAEFANRIHASLQKAAAQEARTARGRGRLWLQWGTMAAALAMVIGLAVVGVAWRRTAETTIAGEVLDSHLRSLQAGHLMDVPSTDRHTVRPWFQGRLDFSPAVPDLSSSGWQLLGGRLDYLGGRAVAALVYQRGRHQINVFVWPNGAAGGSELQALDAKGYHLIYWSGQAMSYWGVSDMERPELTQFARDFRNKAEGRGK